MQIRFLFYIVYTANLHYYTAMTPDQSQLIMNLRDPPSPEDGDWEMLDDILHGDELLGISTS